MTAEIVQFVPRPNPKADRAFWIGPEQHEQQAAEIMNVALNYDPAPSEYVWISGRTIGEPDVAPEGGDCA